MSNTLFSYWYHKYNLAGIVTYIPYRSAPIDS
jgi:hypothetical protein